MCAETPPTEGPPSSRLVARLRHRGEVEELYGAVPGGSVRCAGCSRELVPDGCFTLRRLRGATGGPVAVCTFCEPIPPAAVVESLHLVYRACEHPRCAHPRLVSRLRRSGPSLEHAELEWAHERPLSTWDPEEPVHRPRPGRLLDPEG